MGAEILQLLEEGLRHHVLGDEESAIRCWKAILEKDPDNDKARRLLEMVARSDRRSPGPRYLEISGGPLLMVESSAHSLPASPPSPPTVEPVVAADDGGLEALIATAGELFSLGDFSGSLELVEKVLEKDSNHAVALDYLAKNRKTLTHFYESKIGSIASKPFVALRPDEILWLNMDHREGFVLSLIDGSMTVDDLYVLSGMSRMDTARILAELLEQGVIRMG